MTLADLPSTTLSEAVPSAKRRRISLQTALGLVFMLTAFLAGTITMVVLVFVLRNQILEGFQARLLDVASLASQRINGDLHASLLDPAQENGPEYVQIKQVLQEIRDINPQSYRFVYTMRLVDDNLVFVVDAETNPNSISHLGDAYADADPALVERAATITGAFVDQEFYTDQWGTYLSGYAPIYTSGGRVDGIVGVDISVDSFLAAERRTYLFAGLAFLVLLPLIGFAGYYFGRRLAEPLLNIIHGTERITGGDLQYRLQYQGWDELSRLTDSFNLLANRLSGSISELGGIVTTRTLEAERRFEYLQSAVEAGTSLGAILDPNLLVSQVTNLIQTRFALDHVGLFLVDEAGEWAVLRAATGEAGERMLERGYRIRIGEGLVGWSISNNQARVALQADQDSFQQNIPELPLTRSEAAIPLRSRERVLGALTVHSEQPAAFDRTSIFVLQMLADQVAVALDKARLLAQRESELEEMQRSFSQLTRSAWDVLLSSRGSLGYRVDEEGLVSVTDPDSGSDVLAPQVSADGYAITFPVRVRGQILGYMQASRPASSPPWSDEDMTLVENLMEQLGIALDNARLYSATQRSVDRERILSNITGRVRSSTNVDTILQTAIRQLSEALKVPRGSIRLVSGSPVDDGVKTHNE